MSKQEDANRERIARAVCQLRGIDPDELYSVKGGLLGELNVPKWEKMAVDIDLAAALIKQVELVSREQESSKPIADEDFAASVTRLNTRIAEYLQTRLFMPIDNVSLTDLRVDVANLALEELSKAEDEIKLTVAYLFTTSTLRVTYTPREGYAIQSISVLPDSEIRIS
jgi:hypothetical protein